MRAQAGSRAQADSLQDRTTVERTSNPPSERGGSFGRIESSASTIDARGSGSGQRACSSATPSAASFWQTPDPETLKGKRDRAILAILLGCGLRRRELADLEFTHLQQREEHWAIVDLVGKGGHIRTVPVPEWVRK